MLFYFLTFSRKYVLLDIENNDIKYISSHGLIQKYFYFLLMLHKNSNLRVIEFYTEIQKTAANCNIEWKQANGDGKEWKVI